MIGKRKKRRESAASSRLLWWTGYVVAAILLQKMVPGLDALMPAMIICLQDGNKRQSAVFAIVCMIIQEGAGTLPFGASLIWYSTVVATYYIGGRFFMGESFMFIIVLSVAMGVSRVLIFLGMGLLQPLPLDHPSMYRIYVLQVLLTPIIWGIGVRTRALLVKNAY